MTVTIGFDTEKALAELLNERELRASESKLDSGDYKMLVRRISSLTADELQLLIAQEIAWPYTIPLAIEKLEREPLLQVREYPGDLLATLLEIHGGYWSTQPEHYAAMREITARALEAAGLPDEEDAWAMQQRLGDDLAEALVHFAQSRPDTGAGQQS